MGPRLIQDHVWYKTTFGPGPKVQFLSRFDPDLGTFGPNPPKNKVQNWSKIGGNWSKINSGLNVPFKNDFPENVAP